MRMLFIGGCGRSGTTLLQRILVAHSKICGGPEFDHGKEIFNLYKRMIQPSYLDRQSYFYDKEGLRTRFKAFYSSLLTENVGNQADVVYFSEKTPSNIQVINSLLEVFDEGKFVCIVRDGRDVLSSHLKVAERYISQGRKKDAQHLRIREVCGLWNYSVDMYKEASKSSLLEGRLFLVKYEELVINPRVVISDLMNWLGLPFECGQLELDRVERGNTAVIDGLWYTAESYRKDISGLRVGVWRYELNLWQRLVANLLMGERLQEMGYGIDGLYASLLRT